MFTESNIEIEQGSWKSTNYSQIESRNIYMKQKEKSYSIYVYMYLAMQLMNKLRSIIDSNLNFNKA